MEKSDSTDVVWQARGLVRSRNIVDKDINVRYAYLDVITANVKLRLVIMLVNLGLAAFVDNVLSAQ